MSNNGTPNSRQFFCSASICFAAIASVIGKPRGVVGMLWSTVATVRNGWRTLATVGAQSIERLRRGHFVNQMQVDVQKRRLPLGRRDHVRIPELIEQRTRRHDSEMINPLLPLRPSPGIPPLSVIIYKVNLRVSA